MAQHIKIATINRNTISYADWINGYQRKAVKSAKAKIDWFNKKPLYHRHFEGMKDFDYDYVYGKRILKLSQEYLPTGMQNKGNLAFCFDAFVGYRDVCGGQASIEVHYDTMSLKGTIYLVA